MKKITRLLVILLALIFILTGCNTNSSINNSTNNKSEQAKKKVVLKLGIWPEDTLTNDIQTFNKWKEEFSAKYPNVEVVPDHYKYATDTFVPMAEAGEVPTIFETWFTEPQKLISGGFVKDITNELKARGWDKLMNPSIKDLLSKDGKIYGIPRDGYALGLYLNLDLFKKAGLINSDGTAKYPKTWDELANDAKIIKEKTGKAGFCLLAKDNAGGWHFSQIAWDFGAKLEIQRNGKWYANLNSPEAIAAMNFVKDLKWKYNALTDNPLNEDWASGFEAIGTGRAAMYLGAQDAVNQPTQVNGLPVDKLSIVPVPAGPGGQYSLMGGTPYMFSANATPDEINAAMNFLEIMGKAPVVTDESIAGLKADAENKVKSGVPVIPPFPLWTDSAYLKAQNDVISQYKNVNMALYDDYYNWIKKEGVLHPEEPQLTQDMYSELTKVLQAVLTDKNANVNELMNTANNNLQTLLDSNINK
ncbi:MULTISPECIES: ABC transporter substrate-binding protein [Thermoanaerobacterium]|uniref:Extracellular solute-binding protein n=2 Tax=Thermoanaerobacterium TaxID=28895 RepID=W9EE34_9THEO|nr:MULTISPECIES: extracellular solute-binding protein [Thermoanaerobacterium]AFK85782.1 extracellular solute-binding protein family 1 [Thermoanaerobacterium saccharolyticum JW/SL-YS485]ETO38009.1 extracellular solute-binding protein [Thermoanaerobacterium aotearoense SCUT27]